MKNILLACLFISIVGCSSANSNLSTPRLKRINNEIAANTTLGTYEIEIEEKRNRYILTGSVEREETKVALENIVRNESPNNEIENRLTVDPLLRSKLANS